MKYNTENYNALLSDIKERINTAQNNALQSVKVEMKNVSFFEDSKLEFLDFNFESKEHYLSKINEFLKETNTNLTFLEGNYRLQVADKDYFIDLLLYHRQLRCLVAIELKIGEFIPEYIGKMQFYLAVLNDKVKLEDENPTIGIILCKDKNKTIVEYALNQSTSPVGIAEYKIVSELPENLRKQLPTTEQIAEILDIID